MLTRFCPARVHAWSFPLSQWNSGAVRQLNETPHEVSVALNNILRSHGQTPWKLIYISHLASPSPKTNPGQITRKFRVRILSELQLSSSLRRYNPTGIGRAVAWEKKWGLALMPEKYHRPHTHERDQAVERMKRDWEAQRQSLAVVRRFNASLSARGYSWFWPKIAAALVSKHHWLIINCDSCGTVVDL